MKIDLSKPFGFNGNISNSIKLKICHMDRKDTQEDQSVGINSAFYRESDSTISSFWFHTNPNHKLENQHRSINLDERPTTNSTPDHIDTEKSNL